MLAGALALLLLAAPVSAHHKPGHRGGPQHGESGDRADSSGRRDVVRHADPSGPEDGPGNSAAAGWCRNNYADSSHGEPFPFKNRGQCVSFFARGGTLDDDGDDDEGSHGYLRITDVRVRDDGTFRLRGEGAEDQVIVSIGGISGKVVGFGQGMPGSDGSWVVEGEWACQDDDSREEARFLARDSDERDPESARFPCNDLES